MRLFTKLAKQFGLEKDIIGPVRYVVRKHSRFQFRRPKTLEARILKDMDNLDFWSFKRVRAAAIEAEKRGWISPPLIGTVKLYFRLINVINRSRFYFEWTRQEAARRKQIYFDQVRELLNYFEEKYSKKQPA
jgi:hypothetical protein